VGPRALQGAVPERTGSALLAVEDCFCDCPHPNPCHCTLQYYAIPMCISVKVQRGFTKPNLIEICPTVSSMKHGRTYMSKFRPLAYEFCAVKRTSNIKYFNLNTRTNESVLTANSALRLNHSMGMRVLSQQKWRASYI
jgi:hypothetical protein